METKYYRAKDFNKLDWSKLKENEYDRSGENYGFGRGAIQHPNGSGYQLTIYGEDGFDSEMWELPQVLNKFITRIFKDGKEENQQELKRALGL